MSVRREPAPLTFVDVETTGLSRDDRVVSLGIVHVEDVAALRRGECDAAATHLIFNPGRPSHPRARKVHGYSDALLSVQDSFSDHAPDLERYFRHSGIVVAHNASFDRRFITKEFHLAGVNLKGCEFSCTMLAHRQAYGAPSGLDAVLKQAGFPARTGKHGALQDAWLAMLVYCWLNGIPAPNANDMPTVAPLNLREHLQTPSMEVPSIRPQGISQAPVAALATGPSSAFASAMGALSPLATVMIAIARADGEIYEAEIESISLLMHTVLSGSPTPLTDDEEQDLLAALLAIQPSAEAVASACDAIVRNPNLQNSVSGWVRQIALADGSASTEEKAAVLAIAEAMREAHARRQFQSH